MRDIDRALHDAVELGDFKTVNVLLKEGANANSLHTNGYTPLMHAIRSWRCNLEQRIQTVRILINNGANASYVAPDNYQAITLANDVELVSLCIDAGVTINRKIATELMYRFSGSLHIRNFLKQLGINHTDWVDSERQLYNRILDYNGNNLFQDELEKSNPFLSSIIKNLSYFKEFDFSRKVAFSIEDEYTLYALSRINEVLLLSFQEKQRPDNVVAKIMLEQYVEFWKRLGLDIIKPIEYHPFLCEIYEVEECSIQTNQPQISDTVWPCLMFGDLLFSRAGVRIRANPDLIDKKTAEGSTLYWSRWRYNRPTSDLSDGWGGNSQWSTRFRLDYWSNKMLYYNVNYRRDKDNTNSDDLSEERRMELLKYRSFIKQPEILDCFPYDYSTTEIYRYR